MSPYTPKDWANGPEGGTPILDTDLEHLETQYAQAVADSAANIAPTIDSQAVVGALRSDDTRRYRALIGTIRNAGSPNWFQFINDASHRPSLFGTIETTATYIRLNYAAAATRVGSFFAMPDEQLTAAGFQFGCSVGLTYTDLFAYRIMEYADYVSYNGSAWVSTGGFFTPTFAAGTLTLTHPTLNAAAAWGVSATARSGPYVAVADAAGLTTMTVQFRDYAGTLITTPDTNMRVYARHGSGRPIAWNPQAIDTTLFPLSNVWIFGAMEA
jgi:hypothetical protein